MLTGVEQRGTCISKARHTPGIAGREARTACMSGFPDVGHDQGFPGGLLPGGLWQRLQTFVVVTTWKVLPARRNRGQGNAQDALGMSLSPHLGRRRQPSR